MSPSPSPPPSPNHAPTPAASLMSAAARKRKADADLLIDQATKRAKVESALPLLKEAVKFFARVHNPYLDFSNMFATAIEHLVEYEELKAEGLEDTMTLDSPRCVISRHLLFLHQCFFVTSLTSWMMFSERQWWREWLMLAQICPTMQATVLQASLDAGTMGFLVRSVRRTSLP